MNKRTAVALASLPLAVLGWYVAQGLRKEHIINKLPYGYRGAETFTAENIQDLLSKYPCEEDLMALLVKGLELGIGDNPEDLVKKTKDAYHDTCDDYEREQRHNNIIKMGNELSDYSLGFTIDNGFPEPWLNKGFEEFDIKKYEILYEHIPIYELIKQYQSNEIDGMPMSTVEVGDISNLPNKDDLQFVYDYFTVLQGTSDDYFTEREFCEAIDTMIKREWYLIDEFYNRLIDNADGRFRKLQRCGEDNRLQNARSQGCLDFMSTIRGDIDYINDLRVEKGKKTVTPNWNYM